MSLIDEPTGQELAREELARPIYAEAQPSWLERALTWVLERISEALSLAEGAPGGRWLLAGLAVMVLGLLGWLTVKWRKSPSATDKRIYEGLDQASTTDYLAVAEEHILEEQWDLALVAATRAIVTRLQSTSVVPGGPGVTIAEVRSATSTPDIVGVLDDFEVVRYGGKSCSSRQAIRAIETAKRSVSTSARSH